MGEGIERNHSVTKSWDKKREDMSWMRAHDDQKKYASYVEWEIQERGK
jgi:hypothetical protein